MSAYTTWDEAIAAGDITDEADGYPDELIVPLVQNLRKAGFTTYQSCSGHAYESDGTLWIKEPPGDMFALNTGVYDRVNQVVIGPEETPYWEFYWPWERRHKAIERLGLIYGVSSQ